MRIAEYKSGFAFCMRSQRANPGLRSACGVKEAIGVLRKGAIGVCAKGANPGLLPGSKPGFVPGSKSGFAEGIKSGLLQGNKSVFVRQGANRGLCTREQIGMQGSKSGFVRQEANRGCAPGNKSCKRANLGYMLSLATPELIGFLRLNKHLALANIYLCAERENLVACRANAVFASTGSMFGLKG